MIVSKKLTTFPSVFPLVMSVCLDFGSDVTNPHITTRRLTCKKIISTTPKFATVSPSFTSSSTPKFALHLCSCISRLQLLGCKCRQETCITGNPNNSPSLLHLTPSPPTPGLQLISQVYSMWGVVFGQKNQSQFEPSHFQSQAWFSKIWESLRIDE